jgi:hypothetical protein
VGSAAGPSGRRIHQRPRRADVVGRQHLAAVHDGQVGDAAEVDRGGRLAGTGLPGQQQQVEHRDQRRALTASGHVPAAQIANDRQAEAFGHRRGVAQLQRAQGAAGVVDPVVERLPVQQAKSA